jgi:hypothetical protein
MQNILVYSLNIDRKVTTGYHPRCNGPAEQFNKIMVNYIKAQMQQQGKSTLDWEQCLAPHMFNYNTSINKSTKITPFHATFNYNPRVPLWIGVEHRFDKHLKNATGKDTSIPKNLARLRALHHNTRQIVHHNLQHTADLKEEENRKAHPEAKWPSYKINQRVWHYIDVKRETNWKFGPSWEKAIIVGIPSTATYRIRREVGHKKVRTVNMQKLKTKHCRDGDGPPDQNKEEPEHDTKGRRIQEENKSEDGNVIKEDANHNAKPDEQQQEETQVQDEEEVDRGNEQQQDTKSEHEGNEQTQDTKLEHEEREEEESEDEEDKKNAKRYNLRKIKGKTVYVSASKIFRLDNLRDTDDVIEAMKRGYKLSIGGSFFAGSGGGSKTGKQNGRGNQQNDQDTDDNDEEPQPQQDLQEAQPLRSQQKQPRMLTNLARYNAPGFKDNNEVSGKQNQRDRHQMAAECETKRNRIAKLDMQHREKQERMMENIRAEIVAGQQGSTTPSTTTPASSRTASPSTLPEASPLPTRKIRRRERVDKNLQDISARMQHTGQALTSAGSVLFKSMRPNRKYW